MKSLSELRLKVQSDITIDDVVEAIIYKSEQKKIPKSQAFFQRAFHQLQQKVPGLFGDLIFDESGLIPYSDELDSVLFRLEASNVLHTLNPAYRNYQIEDSIGLLEESYNKLHERIMEIDKCASIFSDLIKQQVNKNEQ